MKIIIAGAGRVGYVLAESLEAAGHDITLIDRNADTIERAANEAVRRDLPIRAWFPDGETLAAMDYRSKLELTEDVKKVYTEDEVYEAKTVILATGASHRKLGIPGEKELAGMGVSYCATCDGAFFRGSDVAVIGGGDVAVEDAIFLARGCKKVYVVHRRDELRAAKVLQERLLSLPNVEMVWNALPKSIAGESQVGALHVTDKFTGELRTLHVDGVFVAVGIQPNSGLVEGQLALDAGGYIAAGEDCETSVPGVYAVGDVRTKKLRQIITACGDGANAVTSVQDYLLTH